MARGKNSFVAYVGWGEFFEALSDEQAGRLVKLLFQYVTDQDPEVSDPSLKIAFIAMRQDLKRDLKKWEEKSGIKSESGRIGNLKRWHLDLYKQYKKGKLTLEQAENIGVSRKTSGSDKIIANIAVDVDVDDNVDVTPINGSKKKRFTPPTPEMVDEYFLEKGLGFETAKKESEKFVDYYDSKGWLVGKAKMKNWKAACRNWIKRLSEYQKEKGSAEKEKVNFLKQRYGIN